MIHQLQIAGIALGALVLLGLLVATSGSVVIPSAGRSSKPPEPVEIARGVWGFHLPPSSQRRDPNALPIVFIAGPMFNPLSGEEFLTQYADRDVFFADAPHGDGFFRNSLDRLAWAHILLADRFNITEASFVVHSGGGAIFRRMVELRRETGRSQIVRTVLFIDPAGVLPQDTSKEIGARFRQSTATEDRLHAEKKLESWWSLSNRWRRGIEYFSRLSGIQTLLELTAVGKKDLRPVFPLLRLLHVPYAVAHGDNDEAYPFERVRQALVPRYVRPQDFHVIPGGIHQGVYLMPYTTSRVARSITSELEARRDN